jgi:hypothetical protein
MRKMRWLFCLWPGLPQLWTHGNWLALAVAVGTAIGLDLLLAASFGWSELLGQGLRNILWTAFGTVWIIAAIWSTKSYRRQVTSESPDPQQDSFSEVLDLYLKGDYYQAERVLEAMLQENLRDVDARLLLSTLLRHTQRIEEAVVQLDALVRFEGAEKWELEIRRERELLARAKKAKVEQAIAA